MVQVHEQQTISASPERVFDWLLDPANLAVSPMFRNVVWAKDSSGPCVGATREVTGFGFWARFRLAGAADRSLTFRAILAGCAWALET